MSSGRSPSGTSTIEAVAVSTTEGQRVRRIIVTLLTIAAILTYILPRNWFTCRKNRFTPRRPRWV